jgi:hypothetical protein
VTTAHRLALAAAVAVALGASALVPLYDGRGWALPVLGAVTTVAVAASVARRLSAPRLVEPMAATLGLAGYLCLVFARDTLSPLLLPTGTTLAVLRETLGAGLLDAEALAPPVPLRPGLVLLAVLGVGAVAVAVDTLAVTLRAPALAGLPLLLLFAVPGAVLPGGLGWWPFALGAAGWLGVLLADGRDGVTRWGTALPVRSAAGRPDRTPVAGPADPGRGRVGRRIGATALGVAVVVPALVPGMDGRLLGGGTGDGFGAARSTTTYNPLLELGGQLRLPEPGRLLLRYRTDGEPDYLRLTTLDVFDEDAGWSSSALSADLRRDGVQDGIPQPAQTGRADRDVVRASIEIAQLDGPWLPTPFPPRRIEIDGPWLWDTGSQTIFSTRTTLGEVEQPYAVTAEPLRPTPAELRRATGAPEEIAETYAARPALAPYVQELLDTTVAGAATDYDKVVALQSLFRDPARGFRYDESASVPGSNAPDALENFLRGRRGFCEQYASAMAAMVRGLGIPARVAVGFTPGTSRPDGVYEVTTSDAHAWPEVWFSGAGWVRFEPTPRSSQVTTPGYTTPAAPSTTEQEAPAQAPATVSAAPEVPADGEAVDRGADATTAGGGTSDGTGGGPAGRALLVLTAGAAVLALPSLVAGVRRRRRWARPDPAAAWQQVREDGTDVGHGWRATDSPRAAAADLRAQRALPTEAAAALERLVGAAERARYGRPGTVAAPDSGALRADTRAVRRGLRSSATRRQRWTARLAAPATLAWASSAIGAATGDALDRADSALGATGERLRRLRGRRRGVTTS